MESKLNKTSKFSLTALQFLIISLLVLGVFFRFVNLDRKVYWIDESYTSLRISGYKESELMQSFHHGQVIGTNDLLKYQRPNPEKDIVATFKSIAAEDPHHPPLYYLILRLWTRLFGNSIAVQRSLSAVISLLVFPCIYWLCQELFESSLVGWISIALVAISPFHVLYAQEAREYSLWSVTILLSSAALLKSMRVQTRRSWVIYAITVALNIYCHWFSVLVIISHAIYVAVVEKVRLSKTVIAYLLSSLLGFLAFVPWIIVIFIYADSSNFQDVSGWVYAKPSLSALLKSWVISLSRIFFDLDRGWCWGLDTSYCRYPLNFRDPLIYLIIPILILIGYSIYFLFRQTTQRIWLFIFTLAGVTGLALILPDIILGGQRSSMTRYFIPCILGIQLGAAYLLASQITSAYSRFWQQMWRFSMVILISMGVLSCAVSSQTEAWWNKIHNYDTYPISRVINKTDNPLVIYRLSNKLKFGTIGNYIMPIAHLLDAKVQILVMMSDDEVPYIPDGFSDVFVVKPTKELKNSFNKQQNYTMKLIYDPRVELKPGFNMPTRSIWKIEKNQRILTK